MRLFLLFICCILCLVTRGQQFPLQRYSIKEGLSHATVYRVFQDRKGFIWFCTDYGLSVFNGKTFRNYTTEDGLTDNTIISVSEMDDGGLLISTFRGGLCRMKDGHISPVVPKEGALPKGIEVALQAGRGIWMVSLGIHNINFLSAGRNRELIVVDSATAQRITFNRISNCYNKIYFTSARGVFTVKDDTSVVPCLAKSVGSRRALDIKEGGDGSLWICLEDRLLHVYGDSVVHTVILPLKTGYGDMLRDKEGNLWITANSNIYLVSEYHLSNISPAFNIHKVFLNDIFQDREGSIWFASHGEGVYRLNTLDVINFNAQDNKINIYCRAIAPVDTGILWAGSVGTISEWKNNKLQVVPTQHIYPTESIYFIKKVGSMAYIGTSARLITKRINAPFKEQTVLDIGAISAAISAKGEMVLGSYSSAYVIEDFSVPRIDTIRELAGRRINALVFDKDHVLWIGTDSGLMKREKGMYSYQKLPGKTHNIQKMLIDRKGRLWMATLDGLLCSYGTIFGVYNKAKGLAHASCRDIFEDENGNIWIGTLQGFSIIDGKTLVARKYTPRADLSEILSLYVTGDTVFAGTIEGLTILNVKQPPAISLPLYITSVSTSDSLYPYPRSLHLSYRNKKILINFIALAYYQPDKIVYRYKIKNFDNDWRYTSNNSVDISALQPGSYTFCLSAAAGAGEWQPEVQLPLTITKPFWREVWFIILAAAAGSFAIYLLFRWWYAGKRKKIILYNKIIYLRQQALSALINPHFIFNSMNSIQLFLYRDDTKMAGKYLSDFALLVRMTMEDVQAVFINLDREIARLELYLAMEKLRFGDEFLYRIEVDSRLRTEQVRIPNMILQPHIENAIWHGIVPKNDGGIVTISFSTYGQDSLIIIIKDDGVGYDPHNMSRSEDSLGQKITEGRIRLLGMLLHEYYSVKVSSKIGEGTTVEIILPRSPDEKYLSLLEKELNPF